MMTPWAALPAHAADASFLLTMFHTNDLHGRVVSGKDFEDDSRGGLARAATLVRRAKATLPHVLFVDSGDLIHGSPVEFLNEGRTMAEALDAAGVDVACPGNHEFDWGQEVAQSAMRRTRFPWVSANLVDAATGQPFGPLRPYVIRQVGEVKVAFFGLTTLQTIELEWPPFISRIRFLDPFETAAKLVPELRRQADVVILLSHLGVAPDTELAAKVPGIDLILGGHSHTTITTRLKVGTTFIAQTGYYGQNLGRVDLLLKRDEAQKWSIAGVNGDGGVWWKNDSTRPFGLDFPDTPLLPLGPDLQPDDAVAKPYRREWDAWRAMEKEAVGTATAPITDDGAPGDTALSRFLADRLREATGADLTLVDGKWTGRFDAGPVTEAAIWNAVGGYTGQNILTFTVTGEQIGRFLDQWAALPEGLAVGVSGLTARVRRSDSAGERVKEARVNGAPLEKERRYTLSGVMYVLRRFPSLMESAPTAQDGPVQWSRPALLDAARKRGRFEPDMTPRLVWEP